MIPLEDFDLFKDNFNPNLNRKEDMSVTIRDFDLFRENFNEALNNEDKWQKTFWFSKEFNNSFDLAKMGDREISINFTYQMILQAGNKCRVCLEELDEETFELDKFDPRGPYCKDNVYVSCSECKKKRGNLFERKEGWKSLYFVV